MTLFEQVLPIFIGNCCYSLLLFYSVALRLLTVGKFEANYGQVNARKCVAAGDLCVAPDKVGGSK